MKTNRLLALGLCLALALSVTALAAGPGVADDFNTVDYVDDMIRDLAPADVDEPMVIAPAPDFDTPQGQYALVLDGRDIGASVPVAVPLRAMAEALGFNVLWNGDGTITVDDGDMNAAITLGEDLYQVATSNGELAGMSAPFSLGMAPYVVDGTTYVPLELFNALLGNTVDTILIQGGKLSISTAPAQADDVQTPNPFIDCASMIEAAKLAGFTVTLPKTPDLLQVAEGEMIQAFYGKDGSDMLIRKAVGSEDISGDYASYAQVKEVNGVTLKGENDAFSLAIWAKDGYTYCVSVDKALTQAELLALAAKVQ